MTSANPILLLMLVVLLMLRLVEYEAGLFTADHLEDWYNIHLWPFIDRSLDDFDRVAAIQ